MILPIIVEFHITSRDTNEGGRYQVECFIQSILAYLFIGHVLSDDLNTKTAFGLKDDYRITCYLPKIDGHRNKLYLSIIDTFYDDGSLL